jgi:tRNA A37 methylthiotransferase MiaB
VSFAIIRGCNGRRHEVDFGDAAIEVDVAIGSDTVQITVEAIHDQVPSDKRRFATMAIPREKLAAALGADLRERHGPKTPHRLRVVPRND